LQNSEVGHSIPRILREPQDSEHILDVGGVEEFEPAKLHKWNVTAGELDFRSLGIATIGAIVVLLVGRALRRLR
jgi:hypothetical protein